MIAFILEIYVTQIANTNRKFMPFSSSLAPTLENLDNPMNYSPEMRKRNDDLDNPSDSEIDLLSSSIKKNVKNVKKETELSPTRRKLNK